jgi:tRNA(Ile2) C34 agmatinyltransferase TiaS
MSPESDNVNKPLLPTEPGQRRCLKCNEEFPSTGAGNRICKKCSRVNASLNVSEVQLARERGAKRLNGNLIDEQDSYEVNFY